MRKSLNEKLYAPAQEALNDVQLASRKVTEAAHAHVVLMTTLTVVSVVALILAVVAVRRTS